MIYGLKFVNVMEKNWHSKRQISYNKEQQSHYRPEVAQRVPGS